MTQQMDLGGCIFGTKNSRLQMQFKAIAHFSQPYSQTGSIDSTSFTEWPDPNIVWIKAVPKLKLRLSISTGVGLDIAVSDFAFNLGQSLCSSSAWSTFGFVVSCPSYDGSALNDHPKSNSINFGICRNNMISSLAIGRGLPILLHNPPDAHPPSNIPTVSLAEIELSLQFSIRPDRRRRLSLPLDLPGDPNVISVSPAACLYPVNIMDPPMPNKYDPRELTSPVLNSSASLYQPLTNNSPNLDSSAIRPSFESLANLVNSGLQRLTTNAVKKDLRIQIEEDTLQKLSDQAPVIFNKNYRDAMNQRAVSIPILVKAMTSMLQTTENTLLQEDTLALTRVHWLDNDAGSSHSVHEHENTLQSIITSSLWRIAQSKLRKVKDSKGAVTFCHMRGQSTNEWPALDADDHIMDFLEQTDVSDSEILDMGDFIEEFIDNGYTGFDEDILCLSDDFDGESDGPLLESRSQSSFSDIYESTQTTIDDTSEIPGSYLDCEMCFDSGSDSELIEV